MIVQICYLQYPIDTLTYLYVADVAILLQIRNRSDPDHLAQEPRIAHSHMDLVLHADSFLIPDGTEKIREKWPSMMSHRLSLEEGNWTISLIYESSDDG
jgi:hypothetical protein